MRSIPVPRVVIGALALLLVSAAAGPGLVAGDSVAHGAGTDDLRTVRAARAELGAPIDADDVLLHVDVRGNGTAVWRVEYRLRLDDENATEGFEDARAEIESNRSRFVDEFRAGMGRAAASAENATGRPMELRDVRVETARRQLPQAYGVVTYTFRWTGFAAVGDGRLVAGDALSGLFLDEETSLMISWPAGYGSAAVAPAPDERRDRAVVWDGPMDFGEGRPRAVIVEREPTEPGVGASAGGRAETSATTDSGADPAGSDGPGGDGGGQGSGFPTVLVALAGGALAVLGAGTWRYRGRSDAPASDPDLMSNEERVLALLDERGGRVKQAEVAAELDLTGARTSQIVAELREEGKIEVFRLGRENVLTRPESDS